LVEKGEKKKGPLLRQKGGGKMLGRDKGGLEEGEKKGVADLLPEPAWGKGGSSNPVETGGRGGNASRKGGSL